MERGVLVYVTLAKAGEQGYHLQGQSKLSNRRTGSFTIEKKTNPLQYKLQLPDYLEWKDEFSIEHLEPAVKDARQPEPPNHYAQTDWKNTLSILPLINDHNGTDEFVEIRIIACSNLARPQRTWRFGDRIDHQYY